MDWEKVVKTIPIVVDKIRKDRVLKNMTIRDDIFSILEKHCIVIYYPLYDEENCGFHTKRFIKDKLEEVVYINTAKPIADQVFTAAHELGHVWCVARQVMDKMGVQDNLAEDLEERIVNRFAAELLMPKKEFVETFMAHMKKLNLDANEIRMDELIRVSVMQMNDYMVPYESVRRRMIETNLISPKVGEILKDNEKIILALVAAFSKEQNTMLDRVTEKKTIPGLRDLIEKVEQENSLDEYSICKIKKDFDIDDISGGDKVLDILTEDGEDGED